MLFPLYIAKRYIFSKKSHNAINIISAISVCGIALATLAMVIAMSIFNGFMDVIAESFTNFDPDLKITAVHGKVFDSTDKRFDKVKEMNAVEVYTRTIEDNALVKYKDKQTIAVIKGVDDNFNKLTNIENILYGNGEFLIKDEVVDYAIMGAGLVQQLNCGLKFLDALEIYAPKREGKINLANPGASFRHDYLYSPGSVFTVGQQQYDQSYIITNIDFVRKLFNYKTQVSAVELKIKGNYDIDKVKKEISEIIGKDFKVENRYEQQKDIFKIMNVEKLISYIFLTLILAIASINVIGSLSMLIIDKRDDVRTIQNLGANNRSIFRIFLYEGWLISIMGAVIGIALGVIICLVQQYFGIIKLGDGTAFMTSAYPVRVAISDIIIIFITVLVTVCLTIWLPTKSLCKRLLN